MIVVSVAAMAKTTVSLILICFFAVFGNVERLYPYRNVLVVDVALQGGNSFAYGGFIFSGFEDPRWLDHEYGHLLQEEEYGILFETLVAIPSLLSAMILSPMKHNQQAFELDATHRGQQ